MVQRFAKKSCESETWEAVGEPEPLELYPPREDRLVEITEAAD